MARILSVVVGVVWVSAVSLQARIIDHDDLAGVASIPQARMDAVGQQKWFFAHASVGGNMISGIGDLHSSNPTRYQLTSSSVSYNSSLQRANNPPSPTVAGKIYECNRSNPGWQNKLTIFDNSVRLAGWHDTAVDAVMDKFCYIDQTATATTYLNTMAALETAYPDTVVVYTTMPLMTGSDANNVKRNQFNNSVRAYCSENDKLLYDIADMEAYDPSGVQSTFTSGGITYQKLYSGYTSDGGHLNTAGWDRIALGWYATAAIVHLPGDANTDGMVDVSDLGILAANYGTSSNAHWPMGDFNHDYKVDVSDLGILAANYGYGTGAGIPVPEPTSMIFLGSGVFYLLKTFPSKVFGKNKRGERMGSDRY